MSDIYENTSPHESVPQAESLPDQQKVNEPPLAYTYQYTPNVRVVEEKPKKPKKGVALVVIALCFSLLGSLLGGSLVWFGQSCFRPKEPEVEVTEPDTSVMLQGYRENTRIDVVEIDTGKVLTAAEVYAANAGSTVGITTSITTNYFGFQTTSAASGSGFIITDDGYIITNYHVVEGSDSISVAMYNGDTYDAALVGFDESNDLAVLKIEAEGLAPVILGDSDNLNVGDSVVAIGNPLGELTFSLTSGSISAKDREVTLSSNLTMNLLQTDCAINSGNSGGALFNMYGEVIGVTNAKYSSSSNSEVSIDNIGFAIPINDIRNIVESIIEKGYYSKPYLGVYLTEVSEQSQLFGLPKGAAIQSIVEGSPAEQGGLQAGDIITKANDTEISSSNDLTTFVGHCAVDDTITLTVYRQGETVEITVIIGEQIQSMNASQTEEQPTTPNYPGNFPWGRG